jgi:hypothetical protein
MNARDFVQPVHFRELHLLPRVIFAVGAVLFIGSFFIRNFMLGSLGVTVIFAAVSLNFIIGICIAWHHSQPFQSIHWAFVAQLVVSGVITYVMFRLTYNFWCHGGWPPFIQQCHANLLY